jgi:hypothetical protein
MVARISTSAPGRLIVAVLLLAAGACRETVKQSAPESTAVLPPPPTTPVVIAADDTVGCELSRVVAHSDPDSLLQEFVRRDSSGQFTASTDWFNGAVDCPGHEPGPDAATMVSGYTITELARTDSVVQTEVRWQQAGSTMGKGAGTLAETLAVVRTPFGWRIHSPALNPKVPRARGSS